MCINLHKLNLIVDVLPQSRDPNREEPIEPLFSALWPYLKTMYVEFKVKN
jgi:hypothetical protein